MCEASHLRRDPTGTKEGGEEWNVHRASLDTRSGRDGRGSRHRQDPRWLLLGRSHTLIDLLIVYTGMDN